MIDTKQYVIKQIEERNIRFLRLWFTDIFGNLKNVAITPSDIEIAFEEGIGFDGSSIDGLASLQDSDMLVHPDPSTFQVLPWRPSDDGVARMFCDLRTSDGAPAAGDSRHVLMNMLKRAGAMGYSVNIGTAVEYFCFKSDSAPEPIDKGGYFDLAPLDNASDLRRETVLTLEKMGIPVEYSHHEAAPAQQEIDLRFCDALSAADAVVTARLVIKETAHAQGVHASFMPKPIEGQPGSAMHVHQSLFDERGNAFADTNDPDGMGPFEVRARIHADHQPICEFLQAPGARLRRSRGRVVGKPKPFGHGACASLQAEQALIDAHCGAQRRFGGESVFGVRCHAWSGPQGHRGRSRSVCAGRRKPVQAFSG